MKTAIFLFISFFLFTSCQKKGNIIVQNKVHNTKIENINLGDIAVYSSLLPGESSTSVEIWDDEDRFPKINQLTFYMENSGNKVYLKTKNNYRLDYGETLVITIADTTEVINPITE